MRSGVEGLQFWEKFKKWLFPNLFTKGDRALENLLLSWLFKAPNAPKTPSIDIWDFILRAYSCKRPVLRKISRNQTANDFRFSRSDRSGQLEDLRMIIFRWRSSVPVSAWNLQKWPHLGQKKVISGTHLKVQLCSKNHGLGHNGSFRCVRATCVASKPNWESKV